MLQLIRNIKSCLIAVIISASARSQSQMVKIVPEKNENKINVFIGDKLFTSFFYPDTLEKPILYPIYASNGTMVTRGFPIHPLPGEPTDHPHHLL